MWSRMGTYVCLKHVRLVGESPVLSGRIFVFQACAFGRCKCGLEVCLKCVHLVGASAVLNGHIFVSQSHAFSMCKLVHIVKWTRK